MTELAYLRCHCEELISNDDRGRAKLQRHYQEMRKMIGSDERIREAELHLAKAEWKGMDAAWHREQARAEKAEKERDEWRMKWAQEEALGAKDRARVAELEAEIRVCVRHGMPLTKDEVEAREREEG